MWGFHEAWKTRWKLTSAPGEQDYTGTGPRWFQCLSPRCTSSQLTPLCLSKSWWVGVTQPPPCFSHRAAVSPGGNPIGVYLLGKTFKTLGERWPKAGWMLFQSLMSFCDAFAHLRFVPKKHIGSWVPQLLVKALWSEAILVTVVSREEFLLLVSGYLGLKPTSEKGIALFMFCHC